jgi:Flp pilus assembly protein TadB
MPTGRDQEEQDLRIDVMNATLKQIEFQIEQARQEAAERASKRVIEERARDEDNARRDRDRDEDNARRDRDRDEDNARRDRDRDEDNRRRDRENRRFLVNAIAVAAIALIAALGTGAGGLAALGSYLHR